MNITDHIEPVNLDGFLEPSELRALAYAWHALANYAEQKATAMSRRAAGEIRQAEIAERLCEDRYRDIPKELRW
jgi:hypothetical protein